MERLSMMSNANRATVGEPAPRFTCKAIIEGRIRGEMRSFKHCPNGLASSDTAQSSIAAPS